MFPFFPTPGHIPSGFAAWIPAWIASEHPGPIAFDPIGAALCLIAIFVVAFLLGSIPWGVIISHTVYKKDIRKEGSGNIGATNAMRTLGHKGGIAVFVLDFIKGIAAGFVGVFAAYFLELYFGCGFENGFAIAILGCVCGHIFSPWLGWRGGKGITVAFGCIIVVFGPLTAAWILLIFLIAVLITKRISVGSISGAVAEIFFSFYLLWGDPFATIVAAAAGCVVIWAHRGNIKRIMNGTEPRIGDKKKAAAQAGDASADTEAATKAHASSVEDKGAEKASIASAEAESAAIKADTRANHDGDK